ncbi:MAG: hypothetical protein KDK71_00055 [Chlamydiia bacterium]|nr:hypothetical protein [Chlamydiia bacterium]
MKVLPKEVSADFNEKLRLLIVSMKKWGNDFSGVALEIEIEKYMDTLWKYYVEYFQHHIEEAKVTALPYQDLIISHVHLINKPYISRE